jgi:hypothetical protein
VKASDCAPGAKVIIGGKYLHLATAADPVGPLFGVTGTVVAVADRYCGEDYPHGMVQVDLPEGTRWGASRVSIGPEDLSPAPPANP